MRRRKKALKGGGGGKKCKTKIKMLGSVKIGGECLGQSRRTMDVLQVRSDPIPGCFPFDPVLASRPNRPFMGRTMIFFGECL